jgi:transposase
VKAQAEGKLGGADKCRPITPEQMEISRLRAEVARLRIEAEILKKAAAYFAKESL